MKKILLTSGVFMLVGGFTASAQLALTNFNTGFPSTWVMIKADNNTVDPAAFTAPIPTVLNAQAWMNRLRVAGDSAMTTVSKFTPAAKADRWMVTSSFTVNSANMIFKWEDWNSAGAGLIDSLQIWVSPTAGTTTAAFTQKIYEGPATLFDAATPYGTHGASLAAFNGQTIRVAIRNNTYNGGAVRVDNVQTAVLANSLDGKVNDINIPNLVAATTPTPVAVTFYNEGASNITSIQASYKLDAGAPVSQTFSVNIPPLGSQTVTFSTNITNPSVGAHTVVVDILQVNGGTDAVATNNQGTANFAVATSSVPRNGIIEEFTSSTCAPCASFNTTFDPLILTNNANDPASRFNVIKYQMNWPTPNNDVSYNNDGLARRNYYGVTGIPDHYTNGNTGGAGNQTEITNSKAAPAYLTLSGSYLVKGDSLIATVVMTPNFTLSGANYKLYMATTEEHYQNTGNTTGQLNYYHVMRKMLPDGNGITVTSFAAGTPQTFVQRYKYTQGNVTQLSYNFWGNPYHGNLVAFLQDDATKEVMQSVSIPATTTNAVGNVEGGLANLSMYPNPATDGAHVLFTLDKASKVDINVVDVQGRVVYNYNETMGNGKQHVYVPATNLGAGVYNVIIKTEEGSAAQKLTITK